MRSKRTLILFWLTLLLLFAACGSAAEEESSAANTAVPETATEAPAAEPEPTAEPALEAPLKEAAPEEEAAPEGPPPVEMPPPPGEVVIEGLNAPQGVYVAADGSVWAADSGTGGEEMLAAIHPQTGEPLSAPFGQTSRIIRWQPGGEPEVMATLPSLVVGGESSGASRVVLIDGTPYVTAGAWRGDFPAARPLLVAAIAKIEAGEVVELSDTWAIEEADNPDGFILESHPYDITAGPDGALWVADAGANTILRVDPDSGDTELIHTFSEGIPIPFPNPGRNGEMETDPVPTGIEVEEDGSLLVSFLPGFPFLPGTAKVVRVSPAGEVSDAWPGLSSIVDLARAADGTLYAVQFALFSEQGPQPGTGAILRLPAAGEPEVVLDDLFFPTSAAFDANGGAYIALGGVGPPGSGLVTYVDGLAGMEGQPMAAMSPGGSPPGGPPPDFDPDKVVYGWYLGVPVRPNAVVPALYGGTGPSEPADDVPDLMVYLVGPVDEVSPFGPPRENIPTADGPKNLPPHQQVLNGFVSENDKHDAMGVFIIPGPQATEENVHARQEVENSVARGPLAYEILVNGEWVKLDSFTTIEYGLATGQLEAVPFEFGGLMWTVWPDEGVTTAVTCQTTTATATTDAAPDFFEYSYFLGAPVQINVMLPSFQGGTGPDAPSDEVPDLITYLIGPTEGAEVNNQFEIPTAEGPKILPLHQRTQASLIPADAPADNIGYFVIPGPNATEENVKVRQMPENSIVGAPLAYEINIGGLWVELTSHQAIAYAVETGLLELFYSDDPALAYGGLLWNNYPEEAGEFWVTCRRE